MSLRYLRDDGKCSLAEESVSRCSPPVDVVAFGNGVRGGDGLGRRHLSFPRGEVAGEGCEASEECRVAFPPKARGRTRPKEWC